MTDLIQSAYSISVLQTALRTIIFDNYGKYSSCRVDSFFSNHEHTLGCKAKYLCTRRLVGSTDQACSSGFYFRIA